MTSCSTSAGEGLIGFGALELVGEHGRVIFSDISHDVLAVCRAHAAGDPRCDFVRASADALPFPDGSVDVVTTRSVVVYVDDKAAALREFFRVLRQTGRLSMFEPINSVGWREPDGVLVGWDERDLLRRLEGAGFTHVELTVELPVKPHPMLRLSWGGVPPFRAESACADAAGGDGRAADAR